MSAEAYDDGYEVQLIGTPLVLRRKVLEHADEVAREMLLMRATSTDHVGSDVVRRMTELSSSMPPSYRAAAAEMRAALDEATLAGRSSIDVTAVVSSEVAEVMAAMDALFDELELCCRSGKLLTLAAPADCVAYRRWLIGQYTGQLAGRAPVSWSAWSRANL